MRWESDERSGWHGFAWDDTLLTLFLAVGECWHGIAAFPQLLSFPPALDDGLALAVFVELLVSHVSIEDGTIHTQLHLEAFNPDKMGLFNG